MSARLNNAELRHFIGQLLISIALIVILLAPFAWGGIQWLRDTAEAERLKNPSTHNTMEQMRAIEAYPRRINGGQPLDDCHLTEDAVHCMVSVNGTRRVLTFRRAPEPKT